MPNYVTSTCRVHGPADDVARLKATVFRTAPADHSDAGGTLFDFNAIIPMPGSVSAASESSAAEEGMALIAARGSRGAPYDRLGLYQARIDWIRQEAGLPADAHIADVATAFLKKYPDWEEQGKARMRALLDSGYASWYPWAIANWGTKWGAFRYAETGSEPFGFRFETAWSFPTPIFEALIAQYPTLSFECATFDEGWCFAGQGWFNGPSGSAPFAESKATDDLYRLVYGEEPPQDDDEGEGEE